MNADRVKADRVNADRVDVDRVDADRVDVSDPRHGAGDDWVAVAAPGTDPTRLAAVVRRAAVDSRALARQWQSLARDGVGPVEATTRIAASPVLDEAPGDRVASAWRRRGVAVALAGDPGMPDRLVQHGVAPPWLAHLGVAADPATRRVAIVGSRKATGYGTGMAAWLAESLADAGIRVVSGGAVGVDAAAHSAAHGRSGATTVVLGCGHDVAYPRPHAEPDGLFARIVAAGGAVLSEGLAQDPPRPHRVRARNRLVAALADAVVVVEGRDRSGSLVTAGWAADLGIPVLAVPGDVRAPGSAAPHQLLREGAAVCTGPGDVLDVVGATACPPADGDVPSPATAGLPDWLHAPLAAAWPRPVPLARLTGEGRGTGQVLAAITRAQVTGVVTRDVDGVRLRRRPDDA